MTLISFNCFEGIADESGIIWRDDRRFALHMLRDLGFGKGSMEDRIIDEISYLIERFDKLNGEPTEIHKTLTPSLSNNICHLVFGHRYETDDPIRTLLDSTLDAANQRFTQIGFLAMAPTWFTKIVLKIGALTNQKLIDKVFSIVE